MLEREIKYASEAQEENFWLLFAGINGRISMKADVHPDAICTMREVGELFDVLFERMIGVKAETPAAGTAGESR